MEGIVLYGKDTMKTPGGPTSDSQGGLMQGCGNGDFLGGILSSYEKMKRAPTQTTGQPGVFWNLLSCLAPLQSRPRITQ